MKLVYIDESGTFCDQLTEEELLINRRKSSHFILSALIVDLDNWEKLLVRFKNLRADMRRNYGIKKSHELHAHELISGSGIWRHLQYIHLTSKLRKSALKYCLANYAQWPEIDIMSVAVQKLTSYDSITPETARTLAYENLFNRLDKTLKNEKYIVINDGQEDAEIIKILRRMRAFHIVTTSYSGRLDARVKSLIEDPLFKLSRYSFFLQAIDHVAYATLHLFDDRLHPGIARDLVLAEVYEKKGIAAVHRNSALVLPGIVVVPALSSKELRKIKQRALA